MARSEGLPFIACKTMVKLIVPYLSVFQFIFQTSNHCFLKTYIMLWKLILWHKLQAFHATKGQERKKKVAWWMGLLLLFFFFRSPGVHWAIDQEKASSYSTWDWVQHHRCPCSTRRCIAAALSPGKESNFTQPALPVSFTQSICLRITSAPTQQVQWLKKKKVPQEKKTGTEYTGAEWTLKKG